MKKAKKSMPFDWRPAAVAGVLAGFIYGFCAGLLILVLSFTVFHDEQLAQYRAVVPPDASITAEEALKRARILIIPLNMLTLGVVPGALLGVGFAIIRDRLPGRNSRAKGMILASFIWLVALIAEWLRPGSASFFAVQTRYPPAIPFTLLINLIAGWALGALYDRFQPTKKRGLAKKRGG